VGQARLQGRLADLHNRIHRGAYRAQPSRRVYIPKADGRQRLLGIAALEDKIVQQAVVTILNQIYEVNFRETTAPCGVPTLLFDHWPSSDTPAINLC
jgi:retron-type reverse transcriptase